MRALGTGLVLMVAVMGCEQKSGGQPAVVATGGAGDSLFSGFDAKAELQALQGSWKVRDEAFANKEPSSWKIEGDQVTITKGDKTKQGKLEVEYPGELAFVEQSGGGTSRSYYAYARNGSEVYIGLGTAGVKKAGAFMVADDGLILLRANACKYHKKKMFGGWENPVEVQCQVQQDGTREVFSYQIPDRFKKGELQSKQVEVLGEALLNDQMKGHKAEKAQ